MLKKPKNDTEKYLAMLVNGLSLSNDIEDISDNELIGNATVRTESLATEIRKTE